MTKNIYYVYQLVDPRSMKPFYIGEGKNKRAWLHQQFKDGCNNPHKDRVIRKIQAQGQQPIVKLLYENLSKEDAIKIQDKLIAEIGLDNLTNICPSANPPVKCGPENGFYGKKHSPETLEFLRNLSLGIDRKTPEGKASQAAFMKNRWQTDAEYREKALGAIKDSHLTRRKLTKEEWSAHAQKREANLSEQQKESRRLMRKEEWRIRKETELKGKRRKKYIDENGKTRWMWIPVQP